MHPLLPAGPPDEFGDPRTYLAAERTLLAWIRTGLALMGFGFVVARFGLFLRELAAVQAGAPRPQPSVSVWIGTTLVILGVAVQLLAASRHVRLVNRLKRRQAVEFSPWSLATMLAIALALLGLAIALYLILPNQ